MSATQDHHKASALTGQYMLDKNSRTVFTVTWPTFVKMSHIISEPLCTQNPESTTVKPIDRSVAWCTQLFCFAKWPTFRKINILWNIEHLEFIANRIAGLISETPCPMVLFWFLTTQGRHFRCKSYIQRVFHRLAFFKYSMTSVDS